MNEYITYKHYLLQTNTKDSREAFRAYLDQYDSTWQTMPEKMREQCFADWWNRRFIVSAWV